MVYLYFRPPKMSIIASSHRVVVQENKTAPKADIAYNILVEQLLSQFDEKGWQYQLFRAIVNHRKNSRAIDKGYQYRDVNGKRVTKWTTAGWDLEVEWKDGSTTWLPLKELKESSTIEVADYANANRIDTKPAFNWWVRKATHTPNQIVYKMNRTSWI